MQRYWLELFGYEYLGGPGRVGGKRQLAVEHALSASRSSRTAMTRSKVTVSLKAGYRFQADDNDGAYGGPELGYAF